MQQKVLTYHHNWTNYKTLINKCFIWHDPHYNHIISASIRILSEKFGEILISIGGFVYYLQNFLRESWFAMKCLWSWALIAAGFTGLVWTKTLPSHVVIPLTKFGWGYLSDVECGQWSYKQEWDSHLQISFRLSSYVQRRGLCVYCLNSNFSFNNTTFLIALRIFFFPSLWATLKSGTEIFLFSLLDTFP